MHRHTELHRSRLRRRGICAVARRRKRLRPRFCDLATVKYDAKNVFRSSALLGVLILHGATHRTPSQNPTPAPATHPSPDSPRYTRSSYGYPPANVRTPNTVDRPRSGAASTSHSRHITPLSMRRSVSPTITTDNQVVSHYRPAMNRQRHPQNLTWRKSAIKSVGY